ncbi:MAG: transporter [Verrucomicrobiota bacterium]|jgi:hypothetical protein
MKTQIIRCLLLAALAAVPGAIQAQPDAHYLPGLEGIKGSSLPPPGFYLKDYTVFYVADEVNNPARQSLVPPNFQTLTLANVPRAIWITDTKFLGGNVGLDALLPITYQTLGLDTPGGMFHSSTLGIGDFFAESTLSWHPKQFDFAAGVGLFMPTGDSSASKTSTLAGSGFWTPMLTAGATWYPDEAKTWAVSALSRYEFNSEQRDSHETPGQAYTLEWGVSKSVTKTIDCGVVGYYQQRITASKGPNPAEFPYSRVAAVGPEVSLAIPSWMLFASLRYNYEFMAENRAQGQILTLTLTKKF